MSHAQTQSAIRLALSSPNTPVIALTGAWGTGKTFLYKSLAEALRTSGEFTSVYISAMGFQTVEVLKTCLSTQLLSLSVTKDAEVGSKVAYGVKLLKEFLPKGAQVQLQDLALLLPYLKNKLPANLLITIDDIERTETLDIAQLLGFIQLLSEDLGARVLLILNSEKLEGHRKANWDQLREKMISREIRLTITTAEAIAIGLSGLPEAAREVMAPCLAHLNITNIRIIQHIGRNWQTITSGRELTVEAVTSLAPGVVLLTALHLKGIEGWPDLRSALEELSSGGWEYYLEKPDKKRPAWREALEKYPMGPMDQFEHEVLSPFLETGHLDGELLDRYLQDIEHRHAAGRAAAALRQFQLRYEFDANLSPQALAALAADLLEHAPFLSAGDVSALSCLLDLPQCIKDGYVETWIEHNRAKISAETVQEHQIVGSLVELDERIKRLYQERYEQMFPRLSILGAMEHVMRRSGWGQRQIDAIDGAPIEAYEELLRSATPEQWPYLRHFYQEYFSRNSFATGAGHFVSAVRNILAAEPGGRLAAILRKHVALPPQAAEAEEVGTAQKGTG